MVLIIFSSKYKLLRSLPHNHRYRELMSHGEIFVLSVAVWTGFVILSNCGSITVTVSTNVDSCPGAQPMWAWQWQYIHMTFCVLWRRCRNSITILVVIRLEHLFFCFDFFYWLFSMAGLIFVFVFASNGNMQLRTDNIFTNPVSQPSLTRKNKVKQ